MADKQKTSEENAAEQNLESIQADLKAREQRLAAAEADLKAREDKLAVERKEAEEKAAAEKQEAERKEAEERAAAEKLEAERKEAEAKAEVELARKRKIAGEVHFVANGKVYVPVLKKINLPGFLGARTALEICADPEAQAILLEHGEGLIKEIV